MRDEKTVELPPEAFKTILHNAQMQSILRNGNNWKLPYEYVCWSNLLLDIDFDNESIEQILKEQILPQKVDKTIIPMLEKMKISSHWFLDGNYSDEFEDLVVEMKSTKDLDALVEKYLPNVFYAEEKESWIDKLLMSAYIKYSIGKDDEASLVYGLSQDENLLAELFNTILKRSLYEYLMTIKYNKEMNTENFTPDEIDEKINYVEEKWVKNV